MKLRLPDGVSGDAGYAGNDEAHRLYLERWRTGLVNRTTAPFALFVGMNPSGAEADIDDLTVRKEWNWTRMWGLERYIKMNLGTLRMTKSGALDTCGLPLVHPENVRKILEYAERADILVLSTGKPPHGLRDAAEVLFAGLRPLGDKVQCFGVTKAGWPKHTSRLAYATRLGTFPFP
jgi:hypothetical protein